MKQLEALEKCLRALRGWGLTPPGISQQTDTGLEHDGSRWTLSQAGAQHPGAWLQLPSHHLVPTLCLWSWSMEPQAPASPAILPGIVSAAKPESTLGPPPHSHKVFEEWALLAALSQALAEVGSLPHACLKRHPYPHQHGLCIGPSVLFFQPFLRQTAGHWETGQG